ncbi:MAG: prepilin-type N-terminal cleavage/methylation domain-containing protein [Gemmatimonadetes bacterium]|nr:prepilin-type N-terminal cleavage/methylation domain-containing protein [Gemmatimonadota bacterium]
MAYPRSTRRTRTATRGRRPGGFTLIELIMVVTVLGILSAIAIPRLRGATMRAHAAHVIADFSTVRLAGIQYHAETSGDLPDTAAPGVVPQDLEYLLPDGFEFSYETVTYRWRRWTVSLPDGQNYAAGLELTSPDPEILAEILKLYQGEFAFGSANLITLII